MFKIISIGIGGFLGAISRYLLTKKVESLFTGSFPHGTLVVNLLGCFLLGFIFTITLERQIIDLIIRTGITTGFLGSLTTFSTFSLETTSLFREESIFLGITNIFISLIPGLIMVLIGIAAAKLI